MLSYRPPQPHSGLSSQPRGSTLPLLEGPQTDGVTIGDKGECVITPSTDLKLNPGLKGKSKLNYLRNYWLLIGKSAPRGAGGDLLPPCGQETTLPVTALSSARSLSTLVFQTVDSFTPKENKTG